MQNINKASARLQTLLIAFATSIALNIGLFYGWSQQVKQTAKAANYADLLRLHATEFSIAYADTVQDYPSLSYEETMAVSRVRAFGHAGDPNPPIYDEQFGDQ